MKIDIKFETKSTTSAPEMEVVWHKKRIAVVAGISLFFITVSIWYAIKHETSPFHGPLLPANEVDNATEFAKFESADPKLNNSIVTEKSSPSINADLESESPTTAESKPSSTHADSPTTLTQSEPAIQATPVQIKTTQAGQRAISRGHFSTAIKDKEPQNILETSLHLGDSPIKRLYYFTEFEDYRNNHVVHEWYLNEKLKARVRIGVIGNKYRSYSSKYLTPNMVGEWKVVVRKVNGPVLQTAQISFME